MDKNLLKLIKNKWRYVIVIVLFLILDMLCSVLLSAFIAYALYDFVYLDERSKLWIYFLFGLLYIFLKIGINIIIGRLKTALGNSVQAELRNAAFDKIIESNGFIPGFTSASLSTLCVEGIEQLNKYFSEYLPSLYFSMVAPVIFFILFMIINWKIGLVFGICFPIIPFLISLVNKQTMKMMDSYYSMYLGIGEHFSNSLMGMAEIKQFQSEDLVNKVFYLKADKYRKATMSTFILQLLCLSVVDLICYVGTGVCIVLGIMDVQKEVLNAFACIFVIMMALDVFIPLKGLAHAYNVAMNGRAAGAKVLAIINLPTIYYGNEPITTSDLVFDNVSFAYKNHRYVIKDISLKIDSQGLYGFVGRSGAGKSTIVNLLTRSVVPQRGLISLGGKNIYSIGKEYYFSTIDFISYESHLFNDTIKNNFLLVNPYATDREIDQAIKMVQLESFIESVGGLNAKFTQNGIKISGGQKQRLIIACHLTLNRPIRIFDEATSNIDSESEQIILDVINTLAKTNVVLFITHRLNNLENAKWIYVLSKKGLVQQGPHEMLMAEEGEYKTLYDTLFKYKVGGKQ